MAGQLVKSQIGVMHQATKLCNSNLFELKATIIITNIQWDVLMHEAQNWVTIEMLLLAIISVSNSSRKPASGEGLDCENRSVRFQTRPKTRPAASGQAKPGPVHTNLQVLAGSATPNGSNLQIGSSGFTMHRRI